MYKTELTTTGSVCVLIPTKNRRKLLERALVSLWNQTTAPDEIIVVSDDSTDDTKIFLNKLTSVHKNLKVIYRNISGGVNTARNQGIREATSEWVAFLDDDDEFLPDAIKIIRSKVSILSSEYGVAYFNSEIKTDTVSFVGGFQFENMEGLQQEWYDPTYTETMTKFNLKKDCKPVIRKSLLTKCGYQFPESVNGFESYFFKLIARDGVGIRYYPDIVTRIHQESSLQDRLSIVAPKKNPWLLFILHTKQLLEHWRFYLFHLSQLLKKIVTMVKLLLRSMFF